MKTLFFLVSMGFPLSGLASDAVKEIEKDLSKTTLTYCENVRETQCYSLKYSTSDSAVYNSRILKENIRIGVKGAQLKKLEVVFLSLTEVFQAELLRQKAMKRDRPCQMIKLLRVDSPENLSNYEFCWSWAGSQVRKQVKSLRKKLEKMATQPSKDE